jgi:hypothetical protein
MIELNGTLQDLIDQLIKIRDALGRPEDTVWIYAFGDTKQICSLYRESDAVWIE